MNNFDWKTPYLILIVLFLLFLNFHKKFHLQKGASTSQSDASTSQSDAIRLPQEEINCGDIKLVPNTNSIYSSDLQATQRKENGNIILKKKLFGYVGDNNAFYEQFDMIHSKKAANWTFDIPKEIDLTTIKKAYFKISYIADDGHKNGHKLAVWVNNNFLECISDIPHGVPPDGRFNNWVKREFPCKTDSNKMKITLANRSDLLKENWIGVKWIELHLVFSDDNKPDYASSKFNKSDHGEHRPADLSGIWKGEFFRVEINQFGEKLVVRILETVNNGDTGIKFSKKENQKNEKQQQKNSIYKRWDFLTINGKIDGNKLKMDFGKKAKATDKATQEESQDIQKDCCNGILSSDGHTINWDNGQVWKKENVFGKPGDAEKPSKNAEKLFNVIQQINKKISNICIGNQKGGTETTPDKCLPKTSQKKGAQKDNVNVGKATKNDNVNQNSTVAKQSTTQKDTVNYGNVNKNAKNDNVNQNSTVAKQSTTQKDTVNYGNVNKTTKNDNVNQDSRASSKLTTQKENVNYSSVSIATKNNNNSNNNADSTGIAIQLNLNAANNQKDDDYFQQIKMMIENSEKEIAIKEKKLQKLSEDADWKVKDRVREMMDNINDKGDKIRDEIIDELEKKMQKITANLANQSIQIREKIKGRETDYMEKYGELKKMVHESDENMRQNIKDLHKIVSKDDEKLNENVKRFYKKAKQTTKKIDNIVDEAQKDMKEISVSKEVSIENKIASLEQIMRDLQKELINHYKFSKDSETVKKVTDRMAEIEKEIQNLDSKIKSVVT